MCITSANDHVRHVLPANVRPRHYDLTLTPDLKNFKFDGEVTVKYVSVCVPVRVHTASAYGLFPHVFVRVCSCAFSLCWVLCTLERERGGGAGVYKRGQRYAPSRALHSAHARTHARTRTFTPQYQHTDTRSTH